MPPPTMSSAALSQTLGKPAAQADLHYQTATGWFAGVWGSTVNLNPGPGATVEIDAYAGRAWPISASWNARITAVQYIYPNDTAYLRYDYFELAGSLLYEDRLAFTVSWSPDTSRYSSYGVSRNESAATYEMVGQWPLRGPLSATGSVGYYDLSQLFGTRLLLRQCWPGRRVQAVSRRPVVFHDRAGGHGPVRRRGGR